MAELIFLGQKIIDLNVSLANVVFAGVNMRLHIALISN
jgi:hypothetical protein